MSSWYLRVSDLEVACGVHVIKGVRRNKDETEKSPLINCQNIGFSKSQGGVVMCA